MESIILEYLIKNKELKRGTFVIKDEIENKIKFIKYIQNNTSNNKTYILKHIGDFYDYCGREDKIIVLNKCVEIEKLYHSTLIEGGWSIICSHKENIMEIIDNIDMNDNNLKNICYQNNIELFINSFWDDTYWILCNN